MFEHSIIQVTHVLLLCEEAVLKAQMLNLAQMLVKKPNVQFCTKPAIS
jgi:hypothetical protein